MSLPRKIWKSVSVRIDFLKWLWNYEYIQEPMNESDVMNEIWNKEISTGDELRRRFISMKSQKR
jgi:hypothetical protein